MANQLEIGSATGVLGDPGTDPQVFMLYPTSRQPELRCVIPAALHAQARAAVGQYVYLEGELRYQRGAMHPYEILVRQITAYPPEEELPTLEDLRGIAPDATGGMLSEDFVRDLRNAW